MLIRNLVFSFTSSKTLTAERWGGPLGGNFLANLPHVDVPSYRVYFSPLFSSAKILKNSSFL